jgi:hypothetical protein
VNNLRLELDGYRARSSLARQIRPEHPSKDEPEQGVMQGVISSVQTTTCTVTMRGSAVSVAGVPWLGSYRPTAGDTVWIFKNGVDRFILGEVYAGTYDVASAEVATDQGTTTTGSFVDLATAGPGLTMWGSVFVVTVGCQAYNTTTGCGALMSYEAIGPSSSFATNTRAWGPAGFTGVSNILGSRTTIFVNTPGSWAFKALYKASAGGTGRFLDRQLIVERYA